VIWLTSLTITGKVVIPAGTSVVRVHYNRRYAGVTTAVSYRRKAAMKDAEKLDRDFGKIEGMRKRSETDGLQPGPVSDD
jgi:hypothetical protein